MRRYITTFSLFLLALFLGIALLIHTSSLPISAQVVLSGSMEPALPRGSVVITKRYSSRYAVGDVITYELLPSKSKVTHRIVRVITSSGEVVGLVTKGDANANGDPFTVEPEQVIGKVIGAIPLLGYVFEFERHPTGFLIISLLLFFLLVVSELYVIMISLHSMVESFHARRKLKL